MKNRFLNKTKFLFLKLKEKFKKNKDKLPALLAVSVFVTFLFLLPSTTYALFGLLDGLMAVIDPMKDQLKDVLSLHAGALIALVISVVLFVISISLTIPLLDLGTGMVPTGWTFTSGIANMLLLLAFVAIALSLILKIESAGAKKIIPKLIIVAFLMNFSLLFVKILLDISNIIFIALLDGIEANLIFDFFLPVITPLLTIGTAIFAVQSAFLIAITILGLIPKKNVVLWIGLVIGYPLVILPTLIISVILIIIYGILASIFFMYAFFFFTRIIAVQILAILAPLAFICLILPQTRKYWETWLKALIGWLFAGVFGIFFLRLGFLLIDVFQDTFEGELGKLPENLLAGDINAIFGTILAPTIFYSFVIIFFGALLLAIKKIMPIGANMIYNEAEGLYRTASGSMAPVAKGYSDYTKARAVDSTREGMKKGGMIDKGLTFAEGKGEKYKKIAKYFRKEIGKGVEKAGIDLDKKAESKVKDKPPIEQAEIVNNSNYDRYDREAAMKEIAKLSKGEQRALIENGYTTKEKLQELAKNNMERTGDDTYYKQYLDVNSVNLSENSQRRIDRIQGNDGMDEAVKVRAIELIKRRDLANEYNKFKPEDAENHYFDIDNKTSVDAMIKSGNVNLLRTIAKNAKGEDLDKLNEGISRNEKNLPDSIKRYIDNTPGSLLGYK